MRRSSFEDARREIVSLLQAGQEEFDNGNRVAGLSILLEAQIVFSEVFQSEMEKAEDSISIVPAL